MKKPVIGARWTPAESVRIDAGEFQHTNPRLYLDDDSVRLQAALLESFNEAARTPRWMWALWAVAIVASVAFFVIRGH